jgi:D-alanyl-D-alanine carboxypeptidase
VLPSPQAGAPSVVMTRLPRSSASVSSVTLSRLPPAGESEQQTGLLVYLTVKTDGKFADTPAYSWLTRHCVDYGFILRYPNKENAGGISYSSHLFRYVGKTYAHNMRALDMNFDRFTEYLAAQ